jgi:lysophospholipase L1-like esterase
MKFLALTALLILWALPAGAEEFFFRDGDRVVVIGDSITVQGDYGRYIEVFVRTRQPKWTLLFRNAGINGHTAQMGLPYLENDVLFWKPTVAVVNWGMNDGRRKEGVEYYRSGIVPYVDTLREGGVRVVLCSNSPLDIGDEPGTFTDYNASFDAMASFAQGMARERNLPFVDQFHFCHRLWGENRKREKPVPVSDQTLAKHASDAVHARAPGQLTMAYIILKTLHAPGEVSHAAIDAATGKAETRRCAVGDFRNAGGVLSFTRADEASPCWIDDRGAPALELVPFQQELNRMTLQVTALPGAAYELRIDDKPCGVFTSAQLARGINLAEDRESPVCEPGRRVSELVGSLKSATQSAREVLRFQPPPWLTVPDLDAQKQAQFAKSVPSFARADAAIAAAAQPKPHRYELRPVEGAAR